MTLRRSAGAALAVAGSLLVPAAPAEAIDVFVTIGTGTTEPGLPMTGCQSGQTVTYDSTLTVAAGEHTGTYPFHFDGTSSICEALHAGAGSGTLSGALTGSLAYSRTAALVTMFARIYFGPSDMEPSYLNEGSCEWAPTSFNPVTSYVMACRFVLTERELAMSGDTSRAQ